jgi:ArsR family transcriptional regulator
MNRSSANSQPDALVGWMDCLDDPTRLRLLRLLERHELGVVELCDVLQLPQSTVSRHLKVLADQKWVRNRREGTTHLYRTLLEDLDPAARRLWIVARDQTESWATTNQDQLRLARRLRDRQQGSQTFFAGAASQWDKLRGELYGHAFTTNALLALLPHDLTIADLGCGTGPVSAQLAPHVNRVIAVDNSAAMLKAAKRRLSHFENVDLRKGDLEALPIDDASVDAALLLLALTYVPEPEQVLREMSRILKPDGKAIIVDLLPHDREDFQRHTNQLHKGFAPDDLVATLAACGLTGAQITPLPPEPAAKGPALFLALAAHEIG